MSACARFQVYSLSRSAWKVCVGGGMGWFAKSFSCQTQPLCSVEVRVRVGVLTIDQMLDEHIKCQINRSKVRSKDWSTDQILDQQMESYINRLNLRSLDQMLDQQIKC